MPAQWRQEIEFALLDPDEASSRYASALKKRRMLKGASLLDAYVKPKVCVGDKDPRAVLDGLAQKFVQSRRGRKLLDLFDIALFGWRIDILVCAMLFGVRLSVSSRCVRGQSAG